MAWIYRRTRNASTEQVLLAIICVVLVSSGFLIILVSDDSYRRGVNYDRKYEEFEVGEFFTLADDSLLSYLSIDAILLRTTFIESNISLGSFEERYDPFSDLESLIIYSMFMDFNDSFMSDLEYLEIGFYEPKSITVNARDNRTGYYMIWIWDYFYEEILFIFKFKVTEDYSPVIDITNNVVYDNNKKIKPVIIEGIFVPTDSRL